MEQNCLVVASNVAVRKQLGAELRRRGYQVTLCATGAEAIEFCKSISVDTALIEEKLADTTGDSLREEIVRERPKCRVTVMTNFQRVRSTTDQLRFGERHYLVAVDELAELIGGREHQDDEIASFSQLGNDALVDTIDVVIGLLEVDDRNFGGSSHQCGQLARSVATQLGCPPQGVQEIVLGTLLRDIGRVGMPASIEATEGPLDDEQREQMRGHVETSIRLLEHVQFPWKVLPIIRHHHERYDGKGYPDGLRGREIPLGARIVAVVDAWVAMTSPRSHRDARDPDAAMSELMCEAGHQFDPEIVEALQAVVFEHARTRVESGRPTALLIDSDLEFRRLFKLKLVNNGFDVIVADDTEAGPLAMAGSPADIVLVDIDANPEAAFAWLHEMRTDDSKPTPPFVALSSERDRVVRLRALRRGIDDLMLKQNDLEELAARVENVLIRETVRAEGVKREMRRGISGDLENLSMPDIVQTVVVGMKTACVTIKAGRRTGKIWFENGMPQRAECGKKRGENAFYEIVTWDKGGFLIEHGITAGEANLEGDAMFLLMEGLRRMDEGAAAQAAS